jgi:hypothetical protein
VPIARYFMVVGSALVVLLLITSRLLREAPPIFPYRSGIIDRTTIRINSARKWPEKIVIDTSQPTFSPPAIDVAPAQESVERMTDEMANLTIADFPANTMAESKPNARRKLAYHLTTRPKRKSAKVSSSTHVAGNHRRRATSKVVTRERLAHRDSWVGWPFLDGHW